MHSIFEWNAIKQSEFLDQQLANLEGDLVGVPHTLSGQSFIARLRLVRRELNMVAMNNCKKTCVGLHGI